MMHNRHDEQSARWADALHRLYPRPSDGAPPNWLWNKELFILVAEPDVPPDNNAAERSLRHLVINRKVSGGTRSQRGSNSKMTLASLFGTWRARGMNPIVACRQLLSSPQP